MELGIDGNTALVTGSSSGLGKAAAASLAEEGANVVVNGRNGEDVDATVDELNQLGQGQVIGCVADLTVKEDIEKLVEITVDEFGGIDHVVTSMGGPRSGGFQDIDENDWYDAFDLLVMSVVRLVEESIEYLKDGEGSIVMVTSRSVKEAIDSLVLSNSVRMSVIGLEKTLSRELAPDIRVNAVLPGPHETTRQQNLIEDGVERGEYDSYKDGLATRSADIPLERFGQPRELGDVVAFLSSERASYITGTAIPIDGGFLRSNL